MAKKQRKKSYTFSSGHLFWGGVALFIAAWMFVLGILVGRGTAPVNLTADRLQKELADLTAEVKQKEQAQLNAQASRQGNAKPQLGFYEALKDPKKVKPFKLENRPTKIEKTKPKPVQTKKRASPKPTPAKKPPPPKSAQAKSTPPPKPAPKATHGNTHQAAKSKGRFTIQVSAVREPASANRLVAQLRSKGFPAYQVRVDVAGKGAWYRIRVGAFESRSGADRMLARLKASKHSGMVVGTK